MLDRIFPPRQPQEPADALIMQMEREYVQRFEQQRRANLLRVIVPIILALSGLSLPNAIYADVSSGGFQATGSTVQTMIVFVGMLASFLLLRRERINESAITLFLSVCAIIGLLIVNDTVLSQPISLGVIPELGLLLVPIALISVIGTIPAVIMTTVVASITTILIVLTVPHDASFAAFVQHNAGGGVLITVPVSLQIVLAAFITLTVRGLSQTQQQLSTVRVAYERERELDQMKQQFISNVNHELRTPLMALEGYLVLAQEFGRAQQYDQQERMLQLGLESMHHLNQLTASILTLQRMNTTRDTIEMTKLQLETCVRNAVKLIDPRETMDGRRAIDVDVPRGVEVLGNEQLLVEIMVNLLSNACKYSPSGTPIEVKARMRSEGSADVVAVSVRDYGKGIPPSDIGKLFGRFVRLGRDIASPIGGNGLGLAICKAYVERMGGTIAVESSGIAGEGSTFTFTVPLAQSAVPVSAVTSSSK